MQAEFKGPINSQPQGTAMMQPGPGGNRNAYNRQIGPDGQRDWSHGLCGCTEQCCLCCWAVWCPCVVYSKTKQRLQSLQQRGTRLPGDGETCNADCCIYACLAIPGYAWILQIGNRANIRARYAIRGGTCGDCLTSWCCQPCALTQERREIELEENSLQGFSR